MESEIEKFAKDVSGVFKEIDRLVMAVAAEKSDESNWLLPVVLFILLAVGLEKGSEIFQIMNFRSSCEFCLSFVRCKVRNSSQNSRTNDSDLSSSMLSSMPWCSMPWCYVRLLPKSPSRTSINVSSSKPETFYCLASKVEKK